MPFVFTHFYINVIIYLLSRDVLFKGHSKTIRLYMTGLLLTVIMLKRKPGGISMDVLKDRYTITELSEYLNVTDHTLRYYEKEFGLAIPKDDRGRRYYTTVNANIMFQIKSMRDDGLEIKAIRKILQTENVICEKSRDVPDDSQSSLVAYNSNENNINELKSFFMDFKEEIASSVHTEMSAAQEYLGREINKSKLELGACFENNLRKMESKMEKHFQDVDMSLGKWREKRRTNLVKRIFGKALKF